MIDNRLHRRLNHIQSAFRASRSASLRHRLFVPIASAFFLLFCRPPAVAQTAYFNGAQSTVATGLAVPTSVAVDGSGNVYITNNGAQNVLKETLQSGGTYAQSTVATGLNNPQNVAVDGSGNVYIANDGTPGGSSVLKETLQSDGSYTQSTISATGLSISNGVAVDASGNVYIATYSGNNVLKETLQPGGSYVQSTVATGLDAPYGVAVDASGNVYIANIDGNNVLKETLQPGGSYVQSTVATGLDAPYGVAVDASGNVYIDNTYANSVLKETPSGDSYTQSTIGSDLVLPAGVAVDGSGNVYIVATNTNSVLKLQTAGVNFYTEPVGTTGAAQTLTFTFETGGSLNSTTPYQMVTQGAIKDAQGNPLDFSAAATQASTACNATASYAEGDTCTVDVTFTPTKAGMRYGAVNLLNSSGAVIATAYVYGTGTGPQIVYPSNDVLTTSGGGFYGPSGVAVDGAGNIYVADSQNSAVKEIPAGCATSSCVTTLGGGFYEPDGVALDGAGNVYVADYAISEVKEIPAGCTSSSCVTTLGGGFYADYGVSVDGNGNVYVADTLNNAVKKVPAGCTTSSCVTTLGGGFSNPRGVAVDGNGNVYVADYANSAVKEMPAGCASSSCVTTLGGGFSPPWGVAVDGNGNVYVADNSASVKEIPGGCKSSSCVTTLSGWSYPLGVTVDGSGNVYVASDGIGAFGSVQKQDYFDPPSLNFASTAYRATSSDSPQMVTVQNIGNAALTFPIQGTGTNPSISNSFTLGGATTCPQIAASGTAETLTPGSSCVYAIDFVPETVGSLSGSLVLTDNALNVTDASQTVSLSGIATQASQTISFTAPTTPVTYGVAPILLMATSSSGLSVSFSVVSGPATVSGTTLTITGAGTLEVAANQAGNADYLPATQVEQTIMVNPATPAINWPTPAAIVYGTALSATQLNATSAVAGSFAYTQAAGTVLKAGSQTLTVIFTPTDTTDYMTATATVTIQVNPATPAINWPTPAAIVYGTALSATQLNATSAVAGSFAYTQAAGTVLKAGSQTLTVIFTPTDTTDYMTATATVTIQVNPATPAINWPTPAAIVYGTALSATQLNATSAVAGSFAYTQAAGTVLKAGSQTLTVIFTPTDTTDYMTATATVTIQVNPATPAINWPTPAAIVYGTALSATQLNAMSAVAGSFAYTQAAGTVLKAGSQTLTVIFTPTDTTDYMTATATVTIQVNPATPAINWPTPAAIVYGTALSATQLNATSAVAGSFAYTQAAGTVLPVGSNTLSVAFIPTDPTDYTTATASVTLTVSPGPSFTLSASPTSVSVAQNSSGTSTISVADVGGFTGTVALSATGLPSGVTASFAAGTAPGTQVLTLTASSTAAEGGPVTVIVTGTSGALSATGAVALTVTAEPTFQASGATGSDGAITVTPGATTGNTSTISVAGINGYSGTVNLSCEISPAAANDPATCSLSPASVTLNGGTAQTSTLTVTTTAATTVENQTKKQFWPSVGGTALALVLLIGVPRRRRNWLAMLGLLVLFASIGATGCGGGSNGGAGGGGGGNSGTSAGTYTVTVTGTGTSNGSSSSVAATVGTVTLTVN